MKVLSLRLELSDEAAYRAAGQVPEILAEVSMLIRRRLRFTTSAGYSSIAQRTAVHVRLETETFDEADERLVSS